MNRILIALSLPLCSIISCSRFVPAPIDATTSAADFSSRSLADPGLRSYQRKTNRSPRGNTWGVAPTEAAAEFFQPDVAVARAKASTALAAIATSDTSPNPTVGFIPELGQATGVDSPWVLGFSLDFPIETAGKRQFRTLQARYAANSAALTVSIALRAARSSARSALLEKEAATRRTAILKQQAADYETAVTGLRSLMEAGEISRIDLLQTQSLQSRALLDLADAKRHSETSSTRLAAAIGIPVHALGTISFSYGSLDNTPSIPSETRLSKAAMTRRPDVLAALRLEIAKQYPDLNLSPGYTYDQGQNKWALGLTVTLPIDRNLGPIREATAKRAEAAALFNQVQAKTSGELDQALAEVRSARSRISQMQTILSDRSKEIALSEKLAASGEGESSAAILLKIQLRQDEISLLDARVQLHQALGQLEDAAGLGL